MSCVRDQTGIDWSHINLDRCGAGVRTMRQSKHEVIKNAEARNTLFCDVCRSTLRLLLVCKKL